MAMTTMQWPDYVILAAFLAISLGIGIYHSMTGGKQRTTQEFIMANRKLDIIPTALSLFVSFKSAIMILGLTAEMYTFGIQYMVWGCIASVVSIFIAERLFVPWIYPLKLVSINDYLEQRFESKAVRMFGSSIAILGGIMHMGVAMYAPSAALESATGLPINVSIPLMSVITIAYTTLGGMRAVIWTDVFQFAIMMGGVLAVFIKGLIVVGGAQNVFDTCYEHGRLQAFNWSFDPTERHTVWGFLFGLGSSWVMVHGVQQASVQRFSATKSLAKARLTLLLNIPAVILLYFIVCSTGLIVFTYYSNIQCDPVVHHRINPNQLVSLFVATIFSDSPGFTGLFLATLYGAALSSVSSTLSGSAANCWDDILKFKLNHLSERRKALVNRMLVIVFGTLATGIAILCVYITGPIIQISVMFSSSVTGPKHGVFLLGGLSRYANWQGALAGGFSSVCFSAWIAIGGLQLRRRLPTLPPASTAGCVSSILAVNGTQFDAFANTTTTFADEIYEQVTPSAYSRIDDFTTVDSLGSRVEELIGIQKFYGVSYVWYTLLGVICANIIGLAVSFIFRDREAEARVESRHLLPFNKFFTWSDSDSPHNKQNIQDSRENDKEGNFNLNDVQKGGSIE